MRSTRTKIRGPIALIKKGSKTVVGLCRLDDVEGPLNNDELDLYSERHQIPKEIYRAPDYKWRYAWVLSDIKALIEPIPYDHRNGSVIWANLGDDVTKKLSSFEQPQRLISTVGPDVSGSLSDESETTRILTVPYLGDGSHFCRHRSVIGQRYFVESKHGSLEFSDYDEALDYMRNMAAPRWARLSSEGAFEIVSAVGWKTILED